MSKQERAQQIESDKRATAVWHANHTALQRILAIEGPHTGITRYPAKSGEAWVCPRPEKLYPIPRAFHVTGSPALYGMIFDDKPVMPSFHLFFSNHLRIERSHRGAAGYVAEDLLEHCLGVHRGGASALVWAGPKIDNEQVAIEDDIARNPGRGSKLLFDTFFERYIPESVNVLRPASIYLPPHYRFNSDFIRLMTHLKNGESVEDCQDTIRKILHALWMSTGLREGWYNELHNKLQGIEPIPEEIHDSLQTLFSRETSGLNYRLVDALYEEAHSQSLLAAGQAIIIPFKPRELFRRHGNAQLILPGSAPRDPKSIIGVDMIEAEDIDGEVYFTHPDELSEDMKKALLERGISIRSLNEIAPSTWLARQRGTNIISPVEIDPSNPMCSWRYSRSREERQQYYADQLMRGNLAPLTTLKLSSDNPGYLLACEAIGQNVLPVDSPVLPMLRGVIY